MAQEARVHLWCDRHGGIEGQVEGSTQTVTLDGTEYEIELCAECEEEALGLLRRVLDEFGRRVGGKRKKGKPVPPLPISAPVGPYSPSARPDERVDCPKCGANLRVASLGSHSRSQHHMSLFDLQVETGVHLVNARRSPTPKKTKKRS